MLLKNLDLDLIKNPLKTFYEEYGYKFTYGTYWLIDDSTKVNDYVLIKGYSTEGLVQKTIKFVRNWDVDKLIHQLNALQTSINRLDHLSSDNDFYLIVKDKLRLNDFEISFLSTEIERLSDYRWRNNIKLIPCKGIKEIKGKGYLKSSSSMFFPIEAADVWNVPLDEPLYLDNPLSYQIVRFKDEYTVIPKWDNKYELGYWKGELMSNLPYRDNLILEEDSESNAYKLCQLLEKAYSRGWEDCKDNLIFNLERESKI